MAADPEGAAILDALHATRTTARERQTAMERQVGFLVDHELCRVACAAGLRPTA